MNRRAAAPSAMVAACATLIVFSLPPVRAAAQQQVFLDGLAQLSAALAGTYGDEGPRIGTALDTMTAGLEEWDRAIRALEMRVSSEAPGSEPTVAAEIRLSLAKVYLERGRLADAVRALEAAAHPESRRAGIHLRRALLLDAAGRRQEAAKAFRTAWDRDGRDPAAAYYAIRHRGTGEAVPEGAFAVVTGAYRSLLDDAASWEVATLTPIGPLRHGAADEPLLPPSAYAAAYGLAARGDYAGAVRAFRDAAAADPLLTDPAARSAEMRAASTALRQGRMTEARAQLARALARAPDSSEAHRLLGLAYWAEGQDASSVEQFEAAIRTHPRDERSHLALARVLSSAGRRAEAERVLRTAIDALPGSALAHWWLGSLYDGLNRVPEARREFELSASTALGNAGALHAAIGRLARIEGDFPRAAEAFERQVRENPGDPAARRQLARVLLEQDRVEDAFAELVAAALIDPGDADAHAAIGQIHLDSGRYADAARALGRALDLQPSLSDTRYALGTALMRLGRTEDARRELEAFERARRQALERQRRDVAEQVRKEQAALEAAEGSAR
jgi:tetratricopeptide (TPR) repeat protein